MFEENLKKLMRSKKITHQMLGDAIGLSGSAVSMMVNGSRKPSYESLLSICNVLGTTPNYLLYGEQDAQTIPVIGYVQAGLWQEARQWEVSDFKPIYMPTDERFWGRRIYALQVRGNSMNKLYPEGSCVICVSAEDYTNIVGEIESGKKVVVHRKNPMDGTIEATVKEYVKNEFGTFLMPHSTDPSFTPIRTDDGSAGEVKITGVVIGSFRKE